MRRQYAEERLATARVAMPQAVTYIEHKACTRCRVDKHIDEFGKHPGGRGARNPRCLECCRELGKGYTKQRREKMATRPRPAACEACGRVPQRRALHWDHNVATGRFRGWLCSGCNTALGSVDDSQQTLTALIAYLRRHSIVAP